MDFNTGILVETLKSLFDAGIKYEMNGQVGKVKSLSSTDPEDIKRLDCSGFVQYVVYKCTAGNVRLPQGSHRQRLHVRDSGCARAEYKLLAPALDNTVRIGFRPPEGSMEAQPDGTKEWKRSRAGHVWLVINGATYEATKKGGKKQGVKSFLWDVRTADAKRFYTLGPAPAFFTSRYASGLYLRDV